MKFGTAFIMGIFISISALFFFKQEEKVLGFLLGKQVVNATPDKDSTAQKKKLTVSTIAKRKTSVGKQQTEHAYSPFFSSVSPITAIKTVDKTTAAANNILNYTVTITNNGGTDATDLTFSDNVDPNTTVVSGSLKTSPIAADDNYTALGNVGMNVPDANGILANDALGTNPAATFTAVTNAATTQGGSISINANGGISYTPAAGFTGTDTYLYTLSNDAGSSTATITITVSGMIWFINNNSAAATADGRLNTPFKTVADFQAINDGATSHPATSQNIFVYESVTAYAGNVTLLNGQKLIGQDASVSLATITGYTGYTYSTSLLPAMNNANATNSILSAGGATNVVTLNGGSSGSYTIRGLTIGDKGTGSGISGSSFGTLNVSDASITGTGQALNLTTGALSATFASISSSSGTNAVSLTGITGSLTMGTGSLTGSTGTTFNVSGGTVNITYSGNITQANNAAMVNIAGSHTGTITFQTGTLSATNGTGLQFTAANGTYNFNGTNTLNGGDAGVDIAGTSTGGFTFSSATSITNPSGTAFNIGSATVGTGGSGNVTYNGTISKNSGGRAVEIQSKTAGIVAFTGSISSTSTSSGINLASNTGATINFSGGLSLNTGANTAFNATGGGTISATQDNSTIINTITTTTGIGLNVANTTIGASGLSFRSINVNGATKAVSLNTTGSGGFTITGVGTTAGSGGTIQNISTRGLEFLSANNINLNYINLNNANTTDGASPCDDNGNSGCNAAIYISTAANVSLTKVDITTTAQQGANLNNVTGLTISNCTWQGNGNGTQEGALKARNILGVSSITNSTFKNAAFRIAHIINTTNAATATHLTIDGCTFTNDAFDPTTPAGILKQDCFEMRTQSTAVATVIIKNSTFQRAGSYGIQMAAEGASNMTLSITNCTVDRSGQNMAGIAALADGATAVMNANIDGNPLIQSSKEVAVNVFSGIGGAMQATVRNNTSIQGGNNRNAFAFSDVFAHAIEQSNGKVLMTNNKVEFTDAQAIQLATHDGTTNVLNASVDGNTVVTQNNAGNVTAFGIQVLSTTLVPGSTSPTCANIKNNALTLTNASATQPYTFEVETGTASSQINLQSNSGTNQTNITNLWVNNGNIPTDPARLLELKTPGSTINYGGVTCATPTNLALPTIIAPRLNGDVVASTAMADIPLPDALTSISSEKKQAIIEASFIEQSNELATQLSSTEMNTAQTLSETTTPGNVTVSGITLPPSKSLTIKFQVKVNDPVPDGVCSVSNQGSVSGSSISTVLTDNDADVSNGINPTTTLIPVAPSITDCQSNITANTDAGLCTSLQSFSVTAKGCPAPTITYTIHGTATTITSPYAFPIGTTTVDVNASNGVGSDATCQFTVTINNAAPAVTSVSVPANGYYKLGTNLDFTVTFNAAVMVTGTPYIPLTIGSTSRNASYISGSGTTDLLFRYTVANTDLDNDGITVGSAIAANGGTIQNSCGTNAVLTLNSVGSTTGVLVDGVVPTVTINQAAGQADPTSGTTINFTVVFSEPVTGFATGDVTVSGTAGATTATVSEIAPNDGTTFNVAVTGMTTDGTVIASIAAGKASDAAGNDNSVSTSTDNTVTYVVDAAPYVISINRQTPSAALTNASSVTFRVIFSEDVAGVDALDFALTATGTASGSVNTVTPVDEHTYDVNVNSITGDGTLRLDLNSSGTGIKDKDGIIFNDIAGGFTAGQTYTIDQTAPTLTSVVISSNNANAALAKVGDIVTVNFTSSETIQTPTATIATQTATVTPLGGNNYKATYTMASADAEGNIPFSISFSDLAGNAGTPVTATTNASSVTFDRTAPTVVSINRYNPSTVATTATTLVFRVTFSEAVSGVDITDFALATTGTAAGAIATVSASSGTVIDVTVNGVSGGSSGTGTVGLNLKSSGTGIKDAASNYIAGGFTGQSYTIGVPPSITGCPSSARTFSNDAGQCSATITKATLLSILTISGTPAPTVTVKVGTTEITSSYAFPVGTTTVGITASNGILPDATCSYTVTVTDNEAPKFTTNLSVSTNVLWPPNHKLRDVYLTYTVNDNCGCTPVVTVSSNEPINGTGDGDTSPDWIIDPSDNHHIQLRAERGNLKDARVYTITVSCTDANHTTSQQTTVEVAHNITAPQSGAPFKIGSTVNFAGVFWDKPGNKHTANWSIDGTTVKGAVTEPSGTKNGKVTGSYKFNTAGVYKLQMNVTDQNKVTSYCNTNEDLEAIVVIYDPNGGYVYGGGQFASPAGALKSNPNATGLVSYGFTVNYYKGATYPKGETQFEFKAGDLEFNALNFDYLSINGAWAQFKGSGKIIGDQSGYSFVMTIIDGQLNGSNVDKVRMKIYNKNTNEVIYDNQPDASETTNPTTVVGANSTVVISGSGAALTKGHHRLINDDSGEQYLGVTAMPNPTTSNFTVQLSSSNKKDHITLQVFDQYGRMIETQKTYAGSNLNIGGLYRPGVYYVRIMQGKEHKQIKLLKLPD